jgi:hypothetical protein
MPEPPGAFRVHPAALPADELLRDCSVTFTRRSGPGGQNRNKVETAVVLTHRPSGITAQAAEERSQAANRAAAVDRLRKRLALEIRLPFDPLASPSALWRSRCRNQRISVNPAHRDFPALLAEALDALAACDWKVPEAANSLRCSSTQLVRLLAFDRPAWTLLNRERHARGLPPLA